VDWRRRLAIKRRNRQVLGRKSLLRSLVFYTVNAPVVERPTKWAWRAEHTKTSLE